MSLPSPWLLRFAHLLQPGASVLDVACGSGRNLRWLADRGFRVTGIDRDRAALDPLRDGVGIGAGMNPKTGTEIVVADIEAGAWPLAGRRFDAVLVCNYLWRPLWPALTDAVSDGGFYIHETFAEGQQSIGKPSRPDFLLQPGELLQACAGLQTVAYENGYDSGVDPTPTAPATSGGRFVQRIVAYRPPTAPGCQPPRLEVGRQGGAQGSAQGSGQDSAKPERQNGGS